MFRDYKYIYVRLIRMVVSNYTNVTGNERRRKKEERNHVERY